MATLVTDEGRVHYEAIGRGRPVLLLHGWMNSWNVWRTTVEFLSREFRVYALDWFGFGDSDDEAAEFSVDKFTALVEQFMARLGIARAPLVGHSMGGTVALKYALQYPHRVVKVIVVGSPIEGSSLSPLLKLAAFEGWQPVAEKAPALFGPVQSGLKVFMRGYSHFLAKDARTVGNMLVTDLGKLSPLPFLESIGTLRQTDLRAALPGIRVPVLGIFGTHDNLVNPNQGAVLKQFVPDSEIAWFEDSGHFPMMDEAERFHQTVRDFLARA